MCLRNKIFCVATLHFTAFNVFSVSSVVQIDVEVNFIFLQKKKYYLILNNWNNRSDWPSDLNFYR